MSCGKNPHRVQRIAEPHPLLQLASVGVYQSARWRERQRTKRPAAAAVLGYARLGRPRDVRLEIQESRQSLSITTFRFVPADLDLNDPEAASYLNELNLALLTRLQSSGAAYLSNAVVHENLLCVPAL